MGLTRDAALAAIEKRRREFIKLEVPEWGGDVYIARLTGDAIDDPVLASGATKPVEMLIASLCDENGTLLFTEADAPALKAADLAVLSRVYLECLRANGMMSDDLEKMVEGFGEALRDDSSTG